MITGSQLDQIEQRAGVKTATNFGEIISRAIPYIYMAAGIALLIYIIMGGYKIMTAEGDPKKMEGGKQILTNAFMGFIIIFISFWIIQLLALVLGLQPVIDIFVGSTQ